MARYLPSNIQPTSSLSLCLMCGLSGILVEPNKHLSHLWKKLGEAVLFQRVLASWLTQFHMLRSVRRKTAVLWQAYSIRTFVPCSMRLQGIWFCFLEALGSASHESKNGTSVPGESLLSIWTSSSFQSITQALYNCETFHRFLFPSRESPLGFSFLW